VNGTSINATVQTGGVAAVAGAAYVHIENLTQYAAAPALVTAQAIGFIPPCPYPGLAYFGPEDAPRFFGREQAISALVASVAKRSFTALVGASGSGKSSVVLAGLAPKLIAQGGWRSTYFRIGTEPDKNPFAALARALEPLTGERGLSDKLEEVQKLSQKLAAGSISLTNTIGQCRAANPGKRVLLIADQFEEVFTLVSDEALRNRFIDTLIAAFPDPKAKPPDVCLVLTLRADFYNMALRHRPLTDRLQDHVENLGPMTRDELRDAIEKPGGVVNVGFEPGLVDTILDDVERRPGSLPLLQFALREMWGRFNTPLLTRADYDAIGGVEGALAKRAHAIFEDATKNETDATSVALFRRLFTRLVTLGEGAEDTRRIVERDELGPEAWALAQKLAGEDNRLVVTAATTPGQETVEVAHEALIRNWPALVDWVNRDRAFISWRNQLRQRLDDWRKSPSDAGTLLRGGPLAVAEEWIARRGDDLNEEEKAFAAVSVALRDTEKRRAEEELRREQERLGEIATAQTKTARAQGRMRWALGAVAAVIIVAAGLFYWQYSSDTIKLNDRETRLTDAQYALGQKQVQLRTAQTALEAKQIELQHQHANLLGELASAELVSGNFDRALRLAAKGARDDLALPAKTAVASTSIATLAGSVWRANWRLSFRAGDEPVTSAAFSPDGSRIVTTSEDKTARVWDVATGKEIYVLRGHEAPVLSAAFAPDGWHIVTASDDKTVRIWDATTGKEVFILRGHDNAVLSAAFSSDGSRIVTASGDKTARIWDAATGKEIYVLRGHEAPVLSAAFAPDGWHIVTASDDKTARIWDATTGKEVFILRGHDNAVLSATFSSDGSRIVTASWDKTARIWDAGSGTEISILRGHEATLNSAVFSPDGSRIVTASVDKTARIWDAATGKEIYVLRGHEATVNSAAFSPDGSHIVTASDDKTARIWDVAPGKEICILHGHEASVNSIAFSPDGSRIVTASDDKTARMWDAGTGKEIAVLRGHDAPVLSVAFSPNGLGIATASVDKTARIWDAVSGKEMAILRGHEATVNSAAFSLDGSRIITTSLDKTARIWDAATGKEMAVLRGHEATVLSAAFSPDGSRIVTASGDNTARIWDAVTGKEISVLRGHTATVTSAAFSPDGSRIVTASDEKTIRVWDAAASTDIFVLRGHEAAVLSATFSPDGSRIVTASADKTARIWDAMVGREISVLRGHDDLVTSAIFSPDGSHVATASVDKTGRVWEVHLATASVRGLLDEVCQHRLPGGLSTMTRHEMRLAGYKDSEPLVDACAAGG
jgi:WD40 repeat protein